MGYGLDGGVNGSLQVSNAPTTADLGGYFNNYSFHAGDGVGGTIDLFTGTASNGSAIYGGGGTLGLQAGLGASATITNTGLCDLSCAGNAIYSGFSWLLGGSSYGSAK